MTVGFYASTKLSMYCCYNSVTFYMVIVDNINVVLSYQSHFTAILLHWKHKQFIKKTTEILAHICINMRTFERLFATANTWFEQEPTIT